MAPSTLFLLLSAIILSSLVVSVEIGPPASYFQPWDPAYTLSTSLDVTDEKFSSYTKTGTTIVGLSCRDGVVLGADTRSTGGPLVMDKNKLKIHTIASRIFCCAAGTSADCDQITRRAGHQLALLRLERELCGEESWDPIMAALISVANSLESAQGGRKPSSVMILGGIDGQGPALYIIDDNKVHQRVNYAALGSGSSDAIALLETAKVQWQRSSSTSDRPRQQAARDNSRFVEDVDIETAVRAVRQAVHAGIMNDLGSGSHIDICVIQKGGVRQWRESLSSEWDQRMSDEKGEGPVSDSVSRAGDLDNSSSVTDNSDGSLGDMIFSRSKLLNFLQGSKGDENTIRKIEIREGISQGDASCHVQKI